MRPLLPILGLACIALAGCGEKDEEPVTEPAPVRTVADGGGETGEPPPADRPTGDSDERSPAELAAARRRAAERTVRAYLGALDAREGKAACELLAPGVIEELKLPRERGSCAASLNASIGYRDPRGLPRFDGVELAEIVAVQAGSRSARVTATVVTEFADREEPSIEDDIVYLERATGGWLVSKPDAALYRAIGAEPPLRSVVPPG